jgi:predicted GNAT family N-acyltransferase
MEGKKSYKEIIDNFNQENKEFQLRLLEENDYNKKYFFLLNQLVDSPEPSFEEWQKQYQQIVNSGIITVYVIEYLPEGIIVANINLVKELKFIKAMRSVCHVEEVIVHEKFRSRKFGGVLMEIANSYGYEEHCFKMQLTAQDAMVGYYEKFGYKKSSNCLRIFFEGN